MAAQTNSVKDIIEKALLSKDPTIQKALEQERALRERTAKELTALFEKQKKFYDETAKTQLDVKKVTEERFKVDAELVQKLNAAIKPLKVGYEVTYPLYFNKMDLVLAGAQDLLKTQYAKIYQGLVPEGYSFEYKPGAVTILEDASTIFGTSKGTFLKAATLNVHLSSIGKSKLSDISLLESETGPWITRTSMVHFAPIPSTIDLSKIDARFAQFTYGYNNSLAYIHSGYSFGGGRDGSTNPYAPEDCSSWISKVTGCTVAYSTEDQLNTYRLKFGGGNIAPDWINSPAGRVMPGLYEPVPVTDPEQIKIGQEVSVYCNRNFNLTQDPKMTERGAGGHTGIYLGHTGQGKDSQAVVLSYNRDMPTEEGFGVDTFPLFPEPKNNVYKKVMLFSVKAKGAAAAASATAAQASLDTNNKSGAESASSKVTAKQTAANK